MLRLHKVYVFESIVIDEISMVGCGMFNFISLRLQGITGVRASFEGISVIVVGDLFQLKPLMYKLIFSQPNADYGPIAANLWKSILFWFERTQIMRQKDEKSFAELLNR